MHVGSFTRWIGFKLRHTVGFNVGDPKSPMLNATLLGMAGRIDYLLKANWYHQCYNKTCNNLGCTLPCMP